MIYFLLLVGLVALVKGADVFVDGSSSLAKKFKIPSIIIGLTIVSLGTSLPEAAVSITASFTGSNDLALSNVTGSNIFNLMIVAGICSIIRPMKTDNKLINRDFPVAIAASVALLIFIIDGSINRYDALAFILGCAIYMIILVNNAKSEKEHYDEETVKPLPVWLSVLFIIFGIAAIAVGGDLVVDSATEIARIFGISETVIGLTIVSIGTSLPELATSIVAAKKGESGLAMGNAVGSCILNILFILGTSALLSPITVASDAIIHTSFMLFTTILMFIFVFTGRSAGRREGLISVTIYVAYMVYVVIAQ